MEWSGLYAILDLPHRAGLDPADVAAAIVSAPGPRGGPPVTALQLRAKTMGTAARLEVLQRVAPPCLEAGVPLIVNDDPDAALALARLHPRLIVGVHLGQDDVPGGPVAAGVAQLRARAPRPFVIGLSTHNPEQVAVANTLGLDYIGYGPVFPTRSKDPARLDPCVGLRGLEEACRRSRLPVVAIGGLDRDRGVLAIQRGASCVAMISALSRPGDDADAIRARVAAIAEALETSS